VIAVMLPGVAPRMLPGDHVDLDACSTQIGQPQRASAPRR
jgi:hypothetical protein